MSERQANRTIVKSLMAQSLLFTICISFPPVAMAYIDPGSVSLFLQGLIAGILGGLFIIKLYWRRFIGAVKRLIGRGNDDYEQ